MRRAVAGLAVAILGVLLMMVVVGMPAFGDPAAPMNNELPERFLGEGPDETGALNIVAAIILDYRAYDTLGEATVLFAAVASMMAVLAAAKGGYGRE